MGLTGEARRLSAEIAASARFVSIDFDRLGDIEPAPPPVLDPERHYLEGSREDVIAYLVTLDAINFGSGWFPTLQKRPGCSGYYTVAWALADHWRAHGPLSNQAMSVIDGPAMARMLGQDESHELMALYARALNQLAEFLGDRHPEALVGDSAEALAGSLSAIPFYDDRGFWKRAQITANDLALAGLADFADIDELTIFADNLVPHVLRMDGVLRYDASLAARIDAGELLPPGDEEREIRACALHACELIAAELGVPPRILDVWLWNRGQGDRYKAVPRHRTRTVFY